MRLSHKRKVAKKKRGVTFRKSVMASSEGFIFGGPKWLGKNSQHAFVMGSVRKGMSVTHLLQEHSMVYGSTQDGMK